MWIRVVWLLIFFILGHHHCIPASPRYLELADSADYFISRENWDRAESKIIEALRLEPANFTNSLLLANLGLVQTNKGEYSKALESLFLGLNIAPSSTVLLNNRAHTYLLMDSISAAVKDIDKSLSIDSVQEWALQTRAFLYLQEKDIQNSTRILTFLRKEFPDNLSVLSGFATIAEHNGDFQLALNNYKTLLNKNPKDEDTREAYILFLIRNDKYSDARNEIRNAINMNPENPVFYMLRGYLHRLNFRIEEAQADKKIAISKGLDPQYVSKFIP